MRKENLITCFSLIKYAVQDENLVKYLNSLAKKLLYIYNASMSESDLILYDAFREISGLIYILQGRNIRLLLYSSINFQPDGLLFNKKNENTLSYFWMRVFVNFVIFLLAYQQSYYYLCSKIDSIAHNYLTSNWWVLHEYLYKNILFFKISNNLWNMNYFYLAKIKSK